MGFIYLWENKIDGKKYLGKRWGSPDSTYIGSGKHFRRAVKKYGLENFERKILEYCDTQEQLREREKWWLDHFNAAADPVFYNISPNSGGGHHGADYRGEKNPMWGKKHPNHKPHIGKENGMYGVHRFGSENPNAKAVIITDKDGVIYEGKCLKEVCVTIFGNLEYYSRMKHLIKTCMKGSTPAKNSVFYNWTGFYKEKQ